MLCSFIWFWMTKRVDSRVFLASFKWLLIVSTNPATSLSYAISSTPRCDTQPKSFSYAAMTTCSAPSLNRTTRCSGIFPFQCKNIIWYQHDRKYFILEHVFQTDEWRFHFLFKGLDHLLNFVLNIFRGFQFCVSIY